MSTRIGRTEVAMRETDKTGWLPAESRLADNRLYRVGALAAILGVVILLLRQTTELMHPMGHAGNTPEDAAASFAEYAAFEHWVAAHLLEFLGFVFVFGALVVLSWRLRSGRARGWALLGALGAGVSLSLAATVQAVDGIALKVMVDRWAAAPAESRELFFEGAYAVRQIEGGFLALLFVVLGLTVLLYGIALVSDKGAPSWVGVVGIAASPLTVATGVVVAHAPFEGLTGVPQAVAVLLGVGMPLLFLWFLLVALFLFQSSRRRPAHHPASKTHVIEGNRTQKEEDHVSI